MMAKEHGWHNQDEKELTWPSPEEVGEFDRQALDIALATLAPAAQAFSLGLEEGGLSLADRERFLRMCDTAYRMGRRAMGLGLHRSRW